jgi:hypothetical protein
VKIGITSAAFPGLSFAQVLEFLSGSSAADRAWGG